MGGGETRERKLHNRNGRKVHHFSQQNKQLKEEIARLRDVVDKRQHEVDEVTEKEIASLSAELLNSEARMRDLRARAPDLIEVHDVRQHGFLGRLWWALGFARTGRLRYERE